MTGGDVAIGEAECVTRVLGWLGAHYLRQPRLEEIAAVAGMSPAHFQRLFTARVGVSPKKFVQHLTLGRAKAALAAEMSVLDAAYEAGLSGPGRLHDLFVVHEAVTPGEWKVRGEGLTLRYGWHDSPFGDCLILAGERGVCGLGFSELAERDATLADLAAPYARARILDDARATAPLADLAFGRAQGRLAVVLRGSPFRLKVWEALLRIPAGAAASYAQVAAHLGAPKAARAVGGACATNAVAWLIPCHRVLRAEGSLGGYRWGEPRKRAMLAWESARLD